jgi:hypothetical protein
MRRYVIHSKYGTDYYDDELIVQEAIKHLIRAGGDFSVEVKTHTEQGEEFIPGLYTWPSFTRSRRKG